MNLFGSEGKSCATGQSETVTDDSAPNGSNLTEYPEWIRDDSHPSKALLGVGKTQ
jgi:hypothetical protein